MAGNACSGKAEMAAGARLPPAGRAPDKRTAGRSPPSVVVAQACPASGPGPSLRVVAIVEGGRAQLMHVEIVDGDGVHGDLAQLLQQLALLGGQHARG